MKRLLKRMSLLVPIFGMIIVSVISCKKKEEPAKPAEVDIVLKSTTVSSISFELETLNAVTVSWAVNKKGESPVYTTEDISDGVKPVTVDNLEPETEYEINAYATNVSGMNSETVTVDAMTTASASVSLELVSKTSSSITFRIIPVNAESCSWTVVESSSDLENVELKKEDIKEEKEITVEDLKENTSYSVVALATNASGEDSKRAYLSAKTETEPVVTIKSIVPEAKQVAITLEMTNVMKYAYAVLLKSDGEPEESDYMIVEKSASEANFMVSGLEPESEYMLYAYGLNVNGYAGAVVSQAFTTEEFIEKPFSIEFSDVTSTDAQVAVQFDKELYSKVHFVLGSEKKIKIDSWNWESVIENNWSNPKFETYEDNQDFSLRNWGNTDYGLDLEATYYAGGVPVKLDGTLDLEAAVWTSAKLKPVAFGESSVKCTLTEVATSMNSVTYKVDSDSESAEYLYTGYVSGEITDNAAIEKNAKTVICSKPKTGMFGENIMQEWLSPEKTYTFIAVAKDTEGKLSAIASKVISTKSLDYEGDATCQVTVAETGGVSMTFDCKKDEGTEKILYYFVEKSKYDEASFLKSLKVNNYKSVPEDGEFVIEKLYAETDYVFGFAPVDVNGVCGKCVILEAKTGSVVFDGNTEADVELQIESVTASSASTWYVKVKGIPNDKVSKYYVKAYSTETDDIPSHSRFASECLKGEVNSYTGEDEPSDWTGKGLPVGANGVLWLLVMDADGKLLPVEEIKVEETWK